MSSLFQPRRKLVALASALALLAVVGVAAADNVVDDVDDSAGIVVGAPGTAVTVSWRVNETGNDGCVATAETPVVVGISPSGPVSASATSLTFTSCDSWQGITFTIASDAAPGAYPVAVDPPDGVGGGDTVTIQVPAPEPPPPPPPTDTTAPVVTAPGDQTLEATSSAGATQTFTATAMDDVDGPLTATCAPSVFPVGATVVTCSATDAAGNTGQATFTVTVQDTTAPALSVPAPITAGATSPAGAVVSFSVSATDVVDGAVTPSCTPASGSTFTIGTTTVECSATDGAGNTSSGSFTVTVTNSGPTVVVPGTHRVAAFDARGAIVNFVPEPTATDVQDGPLVPVCSPASGSRFPLGRTTVTCTATDSGALVGSASFDVVVVDLTPPVVTAPRDVVVVAEAPLSRQDPRVAAFLAAVRAADNVGVVALESNAPPVLPLGRSVVTFTAFDAAGNSDSATAAIELRQPVPGQPAPPAAPPPARVPPANVGGLRVVPLNRAVRLEWRPARNATRYLVTRSDRAGTTSEVYDGRATAFVDRRLVNGQEYRYVVVSYDGEGLRSVGVVVVAVPRLPVLASPRYGAGVRRPPLLKWRRVPRASYYNLQLFRVAANGARTKVMSVWPVRTRHQLPSSWRYGRKPQRLTRGTYEWYLWAGFGRRSARTYGPLLGWSRFVVRPPRR